jgi:PKD repeat protein
MSYYAGCFISKLIPISMKRPPLRHVLPLLLLASVVLVSACKEDDPLPAPIAGWETMPSANRLEVGKPIRFVNLSTNADSYLWDFGDGNTSTEIAPSHTFDESGSFTVKLTATTKDNQTSEEVKVVEVKKRALVAFTIANISFVNPDGEPWDDDGSGPDITFVFGPSSDVNFERTIWTDTIPDVTPGMLPLDWELNPSFVYELTDENYELYVVDVDEDAANPDESLEVMFGIQLNPVLYEFSAINDQNNGLLQVSIGGFAIDLYFQIRLIP